MRMLSTENSYWYSSSSSELKVPKVFLNTHRTKVVLYVFTWFPLASLPRVFSRHVYHFCMFLTRVYQAMEGDLTERVYLYQVYLSCVCTGRVSLPRVPFVFYQWVSPSPSFHFLWGKSSILRRRFRPFDAWFHHTAWTRTPACPFQTGLWNK